MATIAMTGAKGRRNASAQSSPFGGVHILPLQLESVAEGLHVLILHPPEFIRPRYHLHHPVLHLRQLACLEAKEEVAGVLGVDAEVVHRPFRIGFRVRGQPFF